MEDASTTEVVTPETVKPAVKPSTGNKTKGVCDIVFMDII